MGPFNGADERRLKQILLDLLSNAVTFTPQGGDLRIGAGLDENGTLAIAVADNGIGMTEDQFTTAMTPFAQVDSRL